MGWKTIVAGIAGAVAYVAGQDVITIPIIIQALSMILGAVGVRAAIAKGPGARPGR